MKWSDCAAKNGIEQCIRDENGFVVALNCITTWAV
jgi:hypothetical protein